MVHIAGFVLLGGFWGLSPSLYKILGVNAVPISHIIIVTGIGVGIGLGALGLLRDGRLRISRRLVLYGLGCGTLINIPFALQVLFARHVGAAEMAVIFSTAPFINYMIALASGRDRLRFNRVLALIAGFAASAVLVATSGETMGGGISGWTLATFICPLLYAGYNWFTSTRWPEGVGIIEAGMAESFATAVVALPFALVFAMPGVIELPAPTAYWPVAALTLMWIAERLVYFGLIQARGPVYTVQAIYVAAPAGVLYGMAFFGERPDVWLGLSLALIILALWLNNRGAPRPVG